MFTFLKKQNPILGIFLSVFLGVLMYPTVIFGIKLPDCGFLAFIFLTPFLLTTSRFVSRQLFYSFVFFFFYFVGVLYWLYFAMAHFGDLSPVVSLLLLSTVGLILAAFGWGAFKLSAVLVSRLGVKKVWVYPVVLTILDYLKNHFPFGGFPWPMPAYALGHYLTYFQWIDVTGVWGVNFVIYFVNFLLVDIHEASERPETFFASMRLKNVLLALVAFLILASAVRDYQTQFIKSGSKVNLGLVQGNIAQDEKWNPARERLNILRYAQLTNDLTKSGAQLVFWPETAYLFPLLIQDDLETRFRLEGFSLPLITGVLIEKENFKELQLYNAAALVEPDTFKMKNFYAKQHLVPFGEYVPLKEWLTFAKKLTVDVGDFSRGSSDQKPLMWNNIKAGILICYEDIFPDPARDAVKNGANILANLTNDAWYEQSSAPYQHLVFSQFRALENRRALVRATNTGASAMIDPYGKIISDLPWFKEGVLSQEMTLVDYQSPYTRFGDWFVYLLECVLAVLVVSSFLKKTSNSPS